MVLRRMEMEVRLKRLLEGDKDKSWDDEHPPVGGSKGLKKRRASEDKGGEKKKRSKGAEKLIASSCSRTHISSCTSSQSKFMGSRAS
jgi:hypothetical protein